MNYTLFFATAQGQSGKNFHLNEKKSIVKLKYGRAKVLGRRKQFS